MEGKSDEEQEEEEEREVVVVVRGKHSLEDKGTVILSLLSLSLSLSHFTAERNSEFSFLSFGIITPKKKKFFFLPFFLIPFPEKKKKEENPHTQNTQGEKESEEQRNKDVFLLEQMD